MKTRFQMLRQKKKSIDPLVISHFDWDNEWADSLHVPPQGHRGCELDDGLTWNLVDEVVGASEALRGRNLPRTAHIETTMVSQSLTGNVQEVLLQLLKMMKMNTWVQRMKKRKSFKIHMMM